MEASGAGARMCAAAEESEGTQLASSLPRHVVPVAAPPVVDLGVNTGTGHGDHAVVKRHKSSTRPASCRRMCLVTELL